MTMRRLRNVVSWVVFAVLAAGWFVYLRPPVLGGQNSYVFVRGTSMEPRYHTGDLVLVRERDDYRVGDIAAFTVPTDDGGEAVVIHRIVDRRPDGGWVMQGDNRPGVDPWFPRDEQIVGTPQLLIPRVGSFLAALAVSPLHLGLVAALIAAVVAAAGPLPESRGPGPTVADPRTEPRPSTEPRSARRARHLPRRPRRRSSGRRHARVADGVGHR